MARLISCVQIPAASPYSVALASAINPSSLEKGITPTLDLCVSTATEAERVRGARAECLNATHQNDVIAGIDKVVNRAIEPRQAVGEYGRACVHRVVDNRCKLVGRFGREKIRNIDLPVVQQVDGKMPALLEHWVARGTFADAHQQQRRVKRDRREGIGRHATRTA